MTPRGRVLWRYGPRTGWGELDHPSLAVRVARDLIAVTDDYRDRVVLVSISRHRIVWQYGHVGIAGRRRNYLNTPDGLNLLPTSVVARSPTLRAVAALRTP
jgi:hypothetical protein